jgi:hypothetical protein
MRNDEAVPENDDLADWGLILFRFRRRLNGDGDPIQPGDDHMTQEELGQLLDPPVTQGTVAKWEAGLAEPRRRYREQLGQIISYEGLYTGKPDQALVTQFRKNPVGRRAVKAVA